MFVLILNFDNMNLKITGHFNVAKLVVSVNNRSFLGGHAELKHMRVSRTKEGKKNIPCERSQLLKIYIYIYVTKSVR